MNQDIQTIQENSLRNAQFHNAVDQHWVADAQLDEMEKLSTKEKNKKYFDELQAETNSAPVRDKMARLTWILARKNLQI